MATSGWEVPSRSLSFKICVFSAIINLLKLAELRVYKIFVSLPLFSVRNGYKSAICIMR